MKKHFVIDIDNTLIHSIPDRCSECSRPQYFQSFAIDEWIDRVNELYEEGHHITLWTGRGWGIEELTILQLKYHGIKYHNLIMGKPLGIYVDKDAVNRLEEFC